MLSCAALRFVACMAVCLIWRRNCLFGAAIYIFFCVRNNNNNNEKKDKNADFASQVRLAMITGRRQACLPLMRKVLDNHGAPSA